MSLFSTPSPPSEAGGTGPAGGKPDFPSPTKLERNGLTGAELGAQKMELNIPPAGSSATDSRWRRGVASTVSAVATRARSGARALPFLPQREKFGSFSPPAYPGEAGYGGASLTRRTAAHDTPSLR